MRPVFNLHHHHTTHQIFDPCAEHQSAHVPVIISPFAVSFWSEVSAKCTRLNVIYRLSRSRRVSHRCVIMRPSSLGENKLHIRSVITNMCSIP
jgi:hypothetical protein